MNWKVPPAIKVYEALGALADARVKVLGDSADVLSSSGNKTYKVQYDSKIPAITANDNGSYWQGYLGYPSIAFLLKRGILRYDKELAGLLKGIQWKDINSQFDNDYEKVLKYVFEVIQESGNISELKNEVEKIIGQISELDIARLPAREKPPKGY